MAAKKSKPTVGMPKPNTTGQPAKATKKPANNKLPDWITGQKSEDKK